MKHLGKQDLVVRTYIDGALHATKILRRVVYQRTGDCTLWVTWGPAKQQIRKEGESFVLDFHVRTVTSGPLKRMLDKARKQIRRREWMEDDDAIR